MQLLEVSTGNLIHSFDSIVKCAKSLEVSHATAHNRINSGYEFLFKDKLVLSIRKIINLSQNY